MNPSDIQLSRTLHNEHIHDSNEQLYPKQSTWSKIREFQFVDQFNAVLSSLNKPANHAAKQGRA